jgi:hypothetical protein
VRAERDALGAERARCEPRRRQWKEERDALRAERDEARAGLEAERAEHAKQLLAMRNLRFHETGRVIVEIKGEADRLKAELGLAKETASRHEREVHALSVFAIVSLDGASEQEPSTLNVWQGCRRTPLLAARVACMLPCACTRVVPHPVGLGPVQEFSTPMACHWCNSSLSEKCPSPRCRTSLRTRD